ncbi:MAG: PAS domain S-box protein [Archangiaceae bacterium]|nr:PAS domain S-box protein [Archangiaceae bacterium]
MPPKSPLKRARSSPPRRARTGRRRDASKGRGGGGGRRPDALGQIIAAFKARFDIDLAHFKPASLQRRIERRMAAAEVKGLALYAERVQQAPDELLALHDELFLKVSTLFRDSEQLLTLARRIVPAVLADREGEGALRAWVPACSSGEEAWALTIALSEQLEALGTSAALRLFATDVSAPALELAHRAVYSRAELAALDAQRLARWFDEVDGGFQVKRVLRDRVMFSRHDVTLAPPFARVDLIWCRDALVCCDAGLHKRMLPVFHRQLQPHGWLWLGGAETTGAASKLFTPVDTKLKLYRRHEVRRVDRRRDLHASNLALQRTNQELECAREELQTTNQELTWLNDELRTRNGDLVQANERLARGEDRFRLMVDGVKDYAIYMLDPTGRVTSWNEGARRLKGYEAHEIIGQHYSRFFTPEENADQVPQRELETARIEARYEAEGLRVRKDGSRFWANVVMTRIDDASGRLLGFSKVTRDLTERRRLVEALERSELRARMMVNGVREYAIFMLDPTGHVASWNEGARRLKGYEEGEILGRHFSAFYPPEDQLAGKPERQLATATAEGRVEDEGWRVRKDGSRFWADAVITRVDDAAGNLIGFTKVTRDLTERRVAEEALRSSHASLELRVSERTAELERALQARDTFLSIASHELKTPLTSLKLQLQLARRSALSERGLSAEAAVQTFERALRQSLTLEELVDGLLDVSRIQTGHFELELTSVDVSGLLADLAARMEPQLAASHAPLTLEVDRDLKARWDRRRIGQALTNLLSNAARYAPGGPVVLAASRASGGLRMTVSDSGPGIAPERQAMIFDRFERGGTTETLGGLGLGLYIARRVVEAHGGTLTVESQPGLGSRFIVWLPEDAGPGK